MNHHLIELIGKQALKNPPDEKGQKKKVQMKNVRMEVITSHSSIVSPFFTETSCRNIRI